MSDKLQVGDVIYTHQHSSYSSHKIDRVTEKAAFSGSRKFNIEADKNGTFRIIGANKWGPYSGKRMNEQIAAYYEKTAKKQLVEQIKEALNNALLAGVSKEKFEQILALLNDKP